ncbi:hypothetical protein [Demequina globuliformis]|uniref:hypothetical protein n=1 Tax=Demequina globuliformis TaxID=676202 RepID=UPI000785F0D8|nr:hypothetical protein [Demequina globuliformis]
MSIFRRRSHATDPQRDAQVRRALMDAAVRVLGRDKDASLAAIASTAGVDTREAARVVGDRAGLIKHTVLRGAHRVGQSAFLDDGTPPEQIAMLIGRVWEDQEGVLHLTHLASTGRYRSEVERELAPLRATLIDALRRGMDDGTVRNDLPEAALAWMVEQATWNTVRMASQRPELSTDWRRVAMAQTLCSAGVGWRDAIATAQRAAARLDAEHTGARSTH